MKIGFGSPTTKLNYLEKKVNNFSIYFSSIFIFIFLMNSETKCKENYDKKSCAQRGVIGREPMVRKCSSWAPRESVEEGKRRQRSFLGMS